MAMQCFHCGTNLEASGSGNFGRNETCPKCDSDVHVCLNCQHYDESSYNQCREPQAERVLDKEKRNFCEYFTPALQYRKKGSTGSKETFKKLNELFK